MLNSLTRYSSFAVPKPPYKKVAKPEFSRSAKAIRMRRAELSLTQDALAARTQLGKAEHDETTVSQRTVSDVEKAYTGMTNLSAARVFSYLEALEWTPEQFVEATGLHLPGRSEKSHSASNSLEPPRGLGNFVRVEVLQAQGGITESHDDRGRTGQKFLDIPEVLLNGNKPSDCALVEIFSDSMACDDVRLSISEGSQVIINKVEMPQSGDIIVADLLHEGEWKRVLKIVDRTGHIVLRSYNEKHTPIVLSEGMELVKIGVYVNHTGPGRQAMRRLNRARMGIR